MATKEAHPLLTPIIAGRNVASDVENRTNNRDEPNSTTAHLYRNFVTMAISFSINHGTFKWSKVAETYVLLINYGC